MVIERFSEEDLAAERSSPCGVFSLDACDQEVMRYVASGIGINRQAKRDLMLETVEYRFSLAKVSRSVQWLTHKGSCYTAKETVSFGRSLGWISDSDS